ncbi:MAG: hypothetical protein JO332_01065 [Planctomycetaceae bacterium]|nr:hypothetical protein [Planctomycetaceae bacterium]
MKILNGILVLTFLSAILDAQEPPARPLPTRTRCRQTLSVKPWAKGLKQIPSTVIDKGVLKNVPYTSYRAGEYELNIYGDPEAPACFEIGVNGALVNNADARRNCYDIVAAILNDSASVNFLKSLKPEGEKKVRGGITYEITPPTAEDAYGGWWISLYSEALLDKSRASAEEMAKITTTRKDVKSLDAAPPAEPKKADAPAVDPVLEGRWGAADLSDARKAKDKPEEEQAVYKPAVAKKDGVYVTTRTLDDTGYILFVCANSPKHEDREEIIKMCPSCGKIHTFWWNKDDACFVGYACSQPIDNAKVRCSICGAAPRKVRIKHE